MDDGTPEKYLNKIEKKYPNIIINHSVDAERKSKEIENAIRTGKEVYTNTIPLSFWRETIEKGSDIFLLWEDDIWLTANINVDDCEKLMKENNVNLLKVRWWGNENTNVGTRIKLSESIEEIIPAVNRWAEQIVKNRFYLNSILSKLKLIKSTFFLQLYTYYEVGGVFFNKDYWLFLWPKNMTKIEEMIQLGKAAEWKRKHSSYKFTKFINESGRSTFLTSASGAYKDSIGFSMTFVNYYINEEWLNGNFNILENFPENYSIDSIYNILEQASDVKCNPESWRKWTLNFQNHFVSIGASPLG
ncbi:hypothetical protein [Rhizosphaericola mali]|uniref:Glycosyltransferase family 2 protein n=1 Tax=Rhizosphaericola mali TaxID=2545455 RepID=A0A5P2G075_9BACT|nr:hypothetical protein [Rhizosphaericola mali]QES89194.1 hypothetical protein E0W69_011145 [Rhizosphaericola mali]